MDIVAPGRWGGATVTHRDPGPDRSRRPRTPTPKVTATPTVDTAKIAAARDSFPSVPKADRVAADHKQAERVAAELVAKEAKKDEEQRKAEEEAARKRAEEMAKADAEAQAAAKADKKEEQDSKKGDDEDGKAKYRGGPIQVTVRDAGDAASTRTLDMDLWVVADADGNCPS